MAMIRSAPAIAAPFTADKPDTTAAKHRDRAAGGHFCRVDDSPCPGDDAATDQRRDIEWDVVADLHHGVFVHQHLFGEG